MIQPTSAAQARPDPRDLARRFAEVRDFTTRLTEDLAVEDMVVQSMDDVSPTKWHLAHTSWFWEVFVLGRWLDSYRPLDPAYHYLFNSYYVQAGERHCRAQRGWISRPTVAEVMAYRAHVDEGMARLLGDADRVDREPALRDMVELGLNHEQQHQELMLTDLKHVLGVNPLRPAYRSEPTGETSDPAIASPPGFVEFPGGIHEIGWRGPGFAYDNEGPAHRRFLEPFALADRLATNGEFEAFMADGGYERPELWMSAGWAAREANHWTEPFYWERRDGAWWTFTLGGMRPARSSEPVVHLNWYEADAFARWSGARLPREDEWEVAARTALAAGAQIEGNLADAGRFHPLPAQEGPPGELRQLFGDSWEWTSSDYSAYPGYRPLPGAVGEYNGKFMTGQYVLRGGSCATSRSHLRVTYRNFFPPDAAWQFTGVRLARDLD